MGKVTRLRNLIGPVVFWFERLRWYLVLAQGLMVYQIWAKSNLQEYSLETILLYLVVGSAVILVFDAIVVYPGFAKKTSTINPEWVELRDDVKAIREKLEACGGCGAANRKLDKRVELHSR